MMDYFFCVIGTAVVCSLGAMLVPDGENGKYVKLVGGLCLVCALISPLGSFVGGIVEYGESGRIFEGLYGDEYSSLDAEAVFKDALAAQSAKSLSDGLCSLLCSEFELESEDVEVYAQLEGERCQRVSIVLSGAAALKDPHAMIGYVEELLMCECDVVYGRG